VRPIRKVLIANRGEIAVRVLRGCRRMGIGTVAVFSGADRDALHVRMADEAYPIGPPPPSKSYLAIPKLVEVARRAGADAVHPGYGFLSENPAFAAAVTEAGLAFIGPTAPVMQRMGGKVEARLAAREAGVPTVPGSTRGVTGLEGLKRLASEVGFPLMLKATGGGGGKGIRVVERAEDLPGAFRVATEEARKAFGNPEVYVERWLKDPRHVEIQIAGDLHGHVIHLMERECSTQRRHQKLIEESPSPALDDDLRRRMGEAAVRLASAIGYTNLGTMEFLLDAEGSFRFLEVNARLQVEHPVTEMVTGLDLVELQIRIAQGEPLPVRQEDVRPVGHAVEARVCAEDPEHDFVPSVGRITDLQFPGGKGVRVDSGVYLGQEVSLHYDPLLLKVIAHGRDRGEALDRLALALGELRLEGVRTGAPLLREYLQDPEFRAGRFHTGSLATFLRGRRSSAAADGDLDAALIAAALFRHTDGRGAGRPSSSRADAGPWLQAARVEGLRP